MKPFKSLNPGFSFIEIMIAMILFAIFGTSLFQIQTYIFSNTAKAHNKTLPIIKSSLMLSEFELKKFNANKEKQPIDKITIQKQFQQPDLAVTLTVNAIHEKSALFKDFAHAAKQVQQKINFDNKQEKVVTFTFDPPLPQEEKERA